MRLRQALLTVVGSVALATAAFAAKPVPVAIPIEGMTWGGCAAHVREALQTVKGVVEVKPSVPQKLVHVKFDPDKTNVKALVKTINGKTTYRAREPKSSRKASGVETGRRTVAVSGSATATIDAAAAKEVAAKNASLKTVTLRIAGMHWPVGWPPKVEAALVKVDGYKSVKVDVAAKQAVVTYDPKKTDPAKLVKAINEHTTFKASVPKT